MTEQFSNFAQSSLSAPISAIQNTINVASATTFPQLGNFRIVVQSFDATTQIPTSEPELMIVIAVAGKQFTVTRGAESTMARAFASGAKVTHIVTAGVMNALTAASGTPGGTTGQVQYNNAGAFGGIVGSTVGSGGTAGSVCFARISAGSSSPISDLSDTYLFSDGGVIVREHGINAQSLNLGSGGTAGVYSIGNLSGQGTQGFLRFDTTNTTLTGGTADVNILTNAGGQVFLSGADGSVLIENQVTGSFMYVDPNGAVTVRALGDTGGLYADGTNTYLGNYSSGFAVTIDSSGNEFVPGNGYFAGNAIAVGADLIGGDIGLQDAVNGQEIIGTFDSGATYQIGGDSGSAAVLKVQSPAYYSGPAVLIGLGAIDTGFGTLQVPGTAYVGSNMGIGGLGNSTTWLNLAFGNSTTTPLRFNSATLVSSLQNGAMEYDGTLFWLTASSVRKSITTNYAVTFVSTATSTITNTTAETTMFGTGVGSATLPANYFVAGKRLRITGGGTYSTTTVPGNLVINIKYGTTVIATTTLTNLLNSASNRAFQFEVVVTCRTTGATGTVITDGNINYEISASLAARITAALNNAGSTTPINTTTSNAINVTATWATASTSNTLNTIEATVETLN